MVIMWLLATSVFNNMLKLKEIFMKLFSEIFRSVKTHLVNYNKNFPKKSEIDAALSYIMLNCFLIHA